MNPPDETTINYRAGDPQILGFITKPYDQM